MAKHPAVDSKLGSRVRPKRTKVVALYTNPPPESMVVCLDELGPVSPRTYPRAGLVAGRPPHQGTPGVQPRPREGLGLRRPARTGRRALTLTAPSRNTRATCGCSKRLPKRPRRRPLPDRRQSVEPQEPAHQGVAGEPPESEAGLHTRGGVLAQPPRRWWRLFRREALAGQSFADARRSSWPRGLPQNSSTSGRSRWVWGRPPKPRRKTVGALLFTAFEERSTRHSGELLYS